MGFFGHRTVFIVLLMADAFQSGNALKGMIANVPHKVYDNQSSVLQKWEEMEDKWMSLFNDLVDVFSRHLNETDKTNILSPKCRVSITKLFQDAKQMKMWAIKILDANPYHRGGELFDNYLSLGHYEECVSAVSHQDVLPETGPIKGEYCLVHVQPHLPPRKDVVYYNNVLQELKNWNTKTELGMYMKTSGWEYMSTDKIYGVCVPNQCTSDDVKQFIDIFTTKLNYFVTEVQCDSDSKPKFEIYHLFILICLLFILLCEALAEIIKKLKIKISKLELLMKIFTFSENVKQIKKLNKDNRTLHLNGLKFLAMTWTVVGHIGGMRYNSFQVYNQAHLLKESNDFITQPLYNSLYCDDLFFFVSGYLLSYLALSKSLPVKGFVFEVIIPFALRILRILPMVLLVIGLSLLMPFTGSGPFWNYANAEATKRCVERWWSVLYFGTNYERLSESCIGQAWYVCVDVQVSGIILILIYIQKRNRRAANIILIILISLCVVISPVYTHFYFKQPTLIFYHIDLHALDEYLLKLHEPQHHLLPYLAGFGLAKYILYSKPLRLSKLQISIGWAISLTMVGFVTYYPWVWNTGKYPDTTDNVIYSTLALPFWCICTCWLTFTCSTGHGGLLNTFLSLNFFNYLNNVLLMVYLINVPVATFFDWRNETLLQSDDISMIGDSLKIWFFTYIFAYIVFVLYEVPLSNALKTFVYWLIKSKSPIEHKEEYQLPSKEVQV